MGLAYALIEAASFEAALKDGRINSTHIRQLLDETDGAKRLELFRSLIKSGDEVAIHKIITIK